MTQEKKPLKITFAPGCFDHFDGTQEELDALIKEIQDGFQDGSFFEKAKMVDLDELDDDELTELFESIDDNDNPKYLQ